MRSWQHRQGYVHIKQYLCAALSHTRIDAAPDTGTGLLVSVVSMHLTALRQGLKQPKQSKSTFQDRVRLST